MRINDTNKLMTKLEQQTLIEALVALNTRPYDSEMAIYAAAFVRDTAVARTRLEQARRLKVIPTRRLMIDEDVFFSPAFGYFALFSSDVVEHSKQHYGPASQHRFRAFWKGVYTYERETYSYLKKQFPTKFYRRWTVNG